MSSTEEAIKSMFKCGRCDHTTCSTIEVAMTGTGLSKMFVTC